MQINCDDPLKYAKSILFTIIPNMANLSFLSGGDTKKTDRVAVDDVLVAKLKSKFL